MGPKFVFLWRVKVVNHKGLDGKVQSVKMYWEWVKVMSQCKDTLIHFTPRSKAVSPTLVIKCMLFSGTGLGESGTEKDKTGYCPGPQYRLALETPPEPKIRLSLTC